LVRHHRPRTGKKSSIRAQGNLCVERNMESACLPDGRRAGDLDAANIGVFARQPAFPHLAVALCVLTTNVVFTRASLLRTVWAVAAGVTKSDNMTKANTAIFSKMCGNFICCFRRNLVELKRGAILQRKSWPYNQVRTARTEAITFSAKGTNFHLPQFPKSSYSYLRSAIH
jgi:hypothetical protein